MAGYYITNHTLKTSIESALDVKTTLQADVVVSNQRKNI